MAYRKQPQLTKRELTLAAAEAFPQVTQRDIAGIVQHVLDQIETCLASGRDAEFRDFGVLRVVKRAARPGRNPKKPQETVVIPAKTSVRFKPGKRLARKLDMLSGGGVVNDTPKRPRNMTQDELESIRVCDGGFKTDMEEGFGPGVEGDDLFCFDDRDGTTWRLHLGKNGWYRTAGFFS